MLKVYNSRNRKKEKFEPLRENFVGIYVCGPTVYGDSHIGHAKSYVSFDVIVRYLRFLGYTVRYVQNITDVGHLTDDADEGDDKVGEKAREMGLEPMEVAERYTRSYFEDMDALNVKRPDICPRASGHIPEQIEMVRKLIENGHAYEVEGNVYYDVSSFDDYGKLSGRNLEEMEEGGRLEQREEKRNPADFALWKKAEGGHLMNWPSPWSEGYPGWHAECTAMGLKYLGPTLDIHGGGIENIFPHHEDEVAQAEGVTGETFALYWLHNNMVTVNGRKMGKSLGNFITLKDAFAGEPPLEEPIRPMVLRYFILNSHYRKPLDFSAEALKGARKGLERIEGTVA
ncbi:MAG: cysteine--tRNA ligase, partial [Planctomycetota bacterium]